MYQTYHSTPIPNRRRGQTPPPPPPTRFSMRKIVVCLLCILLIIGSVGIAIPRAIAAAEQRAEQERQEAFSTALSAAISPILTANSTPTIGIALTDTKTGITRTYGTTTPFSAASTAKIITALAYYHAVERGERSLTRTLGSYSAQFQIKQMINQSNNQSWEMLVEDLGRTNLQQYAKSIGSDYTVGVNTISPGSMTKVLSQLHQGNLLNSVHTTELLSYMQHTNEESMIPAGAGTGVTVYHKYGLLDGNLHDVGILSKNNSTFSIAIYTKNTNDRDDAARTKVIAQITSVASHIIFSSSNPHYTD